MSSIVAVAALKNEIEETLRQMAAAKESRKQAWEDVTVAVALMLGRLSGAKQGLEQQNASLKKEIAFANQSIIEEGATHAGLEKALNMRITKLEQDIKRLTDSVKKVQDATSSQGILPCDLPIYMTSAREFIGYHRKHVHLVENTHRQKVETSPPIIKI